MIKFDKHRNFKADFKKLTEKQKTMFYQRMKLFIQNPRSEALKVHKLHGNLSGLSAFSLGGDLRIIFSWIDKDHIIFLRIGTHNQVY